MKKFYNLGARLRVPKCMLSNLDPDAEHLVATQLRPETFSNLKTFNTIKAERKDNTIYSV